MRCASCAIILMTLPVILAAWDAFEDASCNLRINECLDKWTEETIEVEIKDGGPQDQVPADSAGHALKQVSPLSQKDFCDCWLGLQAGDCRDTAQKSSVGVQRYHTCGTSSLSSHNMLVIFSTIVAIYHGIRRNIT